MMCTYVTATAPMSGSAGPAADRDWFPLEQAVVYFDHPQEAPIDHALCIDFRGEGLARVAVELDASSARLLAEQIMEILASDEVKPLLS